MNGALRIRTLGEVTITCDGQPHAAPLTGKGRALLVYLAFAGRPCRREFLAELLWPGRSQGQSLTNLRKLLVELRQEVGPWLSITRETVGLNAAPYWLDAADLGQRLAQAEQDVRDEASPELAQALEAALAHYQGEFLEGLDIESEDFEAWATLERERLRFSIMSALDRLVEVYTRHGNARAGLHCTARLVQLDPLREKTYRQAMHLLAQTGQREAALRQYELCRQTLQAELGIAPSAQIVALYERIRAGQYTSQQPQAALPAAAPRLSGLPPPANAFIGRETEVHELLERLDDPTCRLLTIGGPGGIGKTRLASEVARRAAPRFSDGAAFVPLAAISTSEAMLPALLNVLALRTAENEPDLRAVLLRALAEKHLLLVLDNMEHLLGDLSLLSDILASAPRVSLLVTSRQPLALEWEWFYALQGMRVPDCASAVSPEQYSSVQLFVDRARRVRHTFALSDDPAGVVAICRLVEGLPLGIELAAAWVRVMSCSEIAAQLLGLETPNPAVAGRHHSLRALFENMWEQLTERDQHILAQLSIFRGGFTTSAALAVAGAQLVDLARLVHQSLISVNFRSNRYDLHQLLAQFLSEKLAARPALQSQVASTHCAYYMDFLRDREVELRSGAPGHALDELRADINNGRAAWAFAVEQRRFASIERCCTGLNTFFTLNVMHHEALGFFRGALEALRQEPESADRDRVELALQSCLIAPLTAIYGWENRALWPVAERIRDLAERLGNNQQVLTSLILLVDLYASEEWERAVAVAAEAVTFSEQHLGREEQMAAYVLNELPLLFTGRLTESLERAMCAQALFDPNNCLWSTSTYGIDPLVISLSHAGIARVMLGYADQGVRTLDEAERRARALGQPLALCFALAFDAISHIVTRETGRSQAAGKEIVAIATEHGYAHWLVFGPCFCAISLIQQGAYAEGIAALAPAIEQELQAGLTHNLPSWYAHLGFACAHTGDFERGMNEINRGLALAAKLGEIYHEPLAHRLQGEVHLLLGNEAAAEHSFRRALATAEQHESRFYALQAALSLAALLRRQGQDAAGRALLEPRLAWFSEGQDRPDIVQAQHVLGG